MSTLSYKLVCLVVAAFVAVRGAHKKSLSLAGANTAFVIGLSNLLAGPHFGLTLLTFFFTSSKLTNLKHEVKAKLEADYQYGGQRSPTQVLANSLGGTVFAIAAALQVLDVPFIRSVPAAALQGAFLPVPKGTNGGVSTLGTVCGSAGSLLMGLTFWGTGLFAAAHRMSTMNLWQCLLLALIGGVFGNLLDSFLGATVQFSGYSTSKKCMVNYSGPDVVHISGRAVLSNTQVNFVSALTTSLLTASVAVHLA